MKKLERNIPGVYDFDEVLDYLHRGIPWRVPVMIRGPPAAPMAR